MRDRRLAGGGAATTLELWVLSMPLALVLAVLEGVRSQRCRLRRSRDGVVPCPKFCSICLGEETRAAAKLPWVDWGPGVLARLATISCRPRPHLAFDACQRNFWEAMYSSPPFPGGRYPLMVYSGRKHCMV